jgi:hypothetical protein
MENQKKHKHWEEMFALTKNREKSGMGNRASNRQLLLHAHAVPHIY